MSKREDFLRSLFSAIYHLDNAPDLTCNKFHKLIYDALAEEFERGRAEGELEAQTEVVKGYHEYGWSQRDTVAWATKRIAELKRGSK